jgi:6-phosphogluconolactonase
MREDSVFADLDALNHAAAAIIAEAAAIATATRGRFTIALSGGATPRSLYQLLASEYTTRIPWATTHVFFGDERCVPPDHPDSNYAMARDALLAHIPGLESRARRIEGERPARDGASRYAEMLHREFPSTQGTSPSTFDVLLLGVGTDGHTASLFPGRPALSERSRWALATQAPPDAPVLDRVTLTFPALDAARTTLILCAGAGKQSIVARIRAAGARAGDLYPVARVSAHGSVHWLLDRLAMGESVDVPPAAAPSG